MLTANFVLQNIGCHDNKGQSEANLDDDVKLTDSKNPIFGTVEFCLYPGPVLIVNN